MKDVSDVFKEALSLSEEYHSDMIAKEIEKIPQIWCRLEDDSNYNWYLIGKNDGKTVVKYYGYLSVKYPIALVMEECPKDIYEVFLLRGVLMEKYCERFSCEESILRRYVDGISLIDDRFLYDDEIPFDEEVFLMIDEGIKYITPYSFSLEEIK